MLRAATASAALALLAACAGPVYVDATVLGTALRAEDLGALRAVRLEPDPDAGDPLHDSIVADVALAELARRGVARTEDAQVELIVHGWVVEESHWVPPQTRFTHHYRPVFTRRYCTPDGRWVTVFDGGGWTPDVWTTPGYTVRSYSHRAECVLQAPGGHVLWMGELRADGGTADFRRVMEACIPLLFDEYPVPSGQPAERRVELAAGSPPE